MKSTNTTYPNNLVYENTKTKQKRLVTIGRMKNNNNNKKRIIP